MPAQGPESNRPKWSSSPPSPDSMMQYVEGLLSNDLSLSTECTSTDRNQSGCILRACLRTPSVETYRFEHPGNPHRYRAFAGATTLGFMMAYVGLTRLALPLESKRMPNHNGAKFSLIEYASNCQ